MTDEQAWLNVMAERDRLGNYARVQGMTLEETKFAANSQAWAIGRLQLNGFYVRRVVWGKTVASEERREGETIRRAIIRVAVKDTRPLSKATPGKEECQGGGERMTDHISDRALAAREWAARLRVMAEWTGAESDPYGNQDLLECAEFLDQIAGVL